MKILMVYPEYPNTFWSFKHALKFISKKASFPPLGLLTVASLLPKEWDKKLIDLNITELDNMDILWADYVFISAMSIQGESANKVIERCIQLKTKIVAGGPLFTSSFEYYENVDHLVLNEAEITLPKFLIDLEKGKPEHLYTSQDWAVITSTPLPMWDLINMKNYSSMNIQYSRGCPYDCEFCDITVLYGRKPRTKTKQQVIAELDELYISGWRGSVFFVDDNFIGNKVKLKNEILPAIIEWNKLNNSPFYFNTEASINLADDENLMQLMVMAGFEAAFIGIESPNEASLIECNKNQNANRDLIMSVKKIQEAGMEVQGGFIVGFDNDEPKIFEELTNFIQQSGIVTAMVGLLNAPRGTKLQQRLVEEGRMLNDFTGNNTDFSINFIPRMQAEELIDGYKKILTTIYSPKYYYERVMTFMKDYQPKKKAFHLNSNYIAALFKSILKLGVLGEERKYYWKLFFWSLFRKPQLFSLAILFTIYGFHFRKISEGM
ncbi:MAG: B12-binding domain-containing radical SAM protein [Ignavibacteriales bacterium]|nr:B12-binding domain-containing radical SAM protein [Ignavibacteriota bacterium]MCB9250488.1 B12-binding domain-containing radical SAM protein [Ignavibacteriales bacterium]